MIIHHLFDIFPFFSLINHYQPGPNARSNNPDRQNRKASAAPSCKRHSSSTTILDNNGVKTTCTSEVVGSPCHISHNDPESPRVSVKRRGLFFCCSKRAVNRSKHRHSQQYEAKAHAKHDVAMQDAQVKLFGFYIDNVQIQPK